MGSGASTQKDDNNEQITNASVESKNNDEIIDDFPQNYESILRDADYVVDRSSKHKLFEQLYSGVFLNQNKKKYWVDKISRKNCFMLFARDLSITWSEDTRYWHWPLLQHSSETLIPVAELLNVCWLEIHGRFETSKLSPATKYEVVFVVMLKDPEYGWNIPVNLRLVLPDGSRQEHKENLMEKPRAQWIELLAGEFETKNINDNNNGEIEFSVYEYEGGIWKRGLVIQSVVIKPKA